MKFFLTTMLALGLTQSAVAAIKYDKNVPKNIQQQVNDDLAFVKTIQGSSATPFHKEIFGNVDGATYGNFFESRIFKFGYDQNNTSSAVAYVNSMIFNKMFITDNFIKFSHPQISRLMVIFHESRHTELMKGNWPHDDCPVPFLDDNGQDKVSIWTGAKLAGEAACDSTYKGSYGSSTIMLKNIAKFCTNCAEKVKMDADIYATDQLGRIDDDSVKQAMLTDFNAN